MISYDNDSGILCFFGFARRKLGRFFDDEAGAFSDDDEAGFDDETGFSLFF